MKPPVFASSICRRIWIPYFVLGVTLILTLLATYYVAKTVDAREKFRFENAVQSTEDAIEARLDSYITMLRASSGLFAAEPNLSRAQFHKFVSRIELQQRYPGVRGIGFSKRVAPDQISSLTAQLRQQGVSNFAIFPADQRNEYHAVIFLEPLDRRNRAALGFDMFTEQTRRTAMARARDTGLPAASGRVTLVQEIDANKQAGFLIYFPVYQGGITPQTLAERRATLDGFVYSPFRANDLLQGIFGGNKYRYVDFEIYDGTVLTSNKLLYRSNPALAHRSLDNSQFRSQHTLQIAGRTWSIVFTSRPELNIASGRGLVSGVLLSGLIISSVLFGVTRSQARARLSAEQSAADRIELLQQAEMARLEAESANRLKDEFLATLSHELRTPLNAMLGWTQLLRSRKLDANTTNQALETIERNTRLLAQLIEDLLDVSRIINGKFCLNVRLVPLAGVIGDAISAVQSQAAAKTIELYTAIDPDIGYVSGDPIRLQQLVWNLLSNAIKFTPAGGDVDISLTRITLEALTESTATSSPEFSALQGGIDYAQIQVKDTGQGIAPELLPLIFERFRQGDGTITRTHGGLGLGLAIARHITELHQGMIWAESAGTGKGATFTVILPLNDVSPMLSLPAAPAKLSPAKSLSPTPLALANVRVLVVEDDPDTQTLLKTVLEDQGAIAIVTGCTYEAFKRICPDRRPDVLVSDIGLPIEDGYTFISRVRALPPEQGGTIPAVALTAYARDEEQKRALAAGFQVHLAKPIVPRQLITTIASLVKPT